MRAVDEARYYTQPEYNGPEEIDYLCRNCWLDNVDAGVTEVDADFVRVECSECHEPQWEQVVFE